MKRPSVCLCAAVCAVWIGGVGFAQDPEIQLRADLAVPEGAALSAPADGVVTATATVAEGTASLDVTVHGVINAALEPCASDPTACDGTENFIETDPASGLPIAFGCSDGMDNDMDGVADTEDPDCRGIQGWSLSLLSDACFGIASATTMGTAGALIIQDGLRDLQSFEKTEVVDPERNGGQQGAVSAVVLSLSNPVILPQVGESVGLIVTGAIDTSGLGANQSTDPCTVRYSGPDEDGLRGSGEPVKTAITVAGTTRIPTLQNLAIVATTGEGEGPPMGSCCVDAACTVTTEADCAGEWTEGGACDPNPCGDVPPPMGSCCAADNTCTTTTEPECAGDWTEGGVCDPNPCGDVGPPPSDDDATFRVEITAPENAMAGAKAGGVVPYSIDSEAAVEVTAGLFLQSNLAPCRDDPTTCDGTENFIETDPASGLPIAFGCSDGMDNDMDGMTDTEDTDCRGIQGWSVSVRTDDCFNIAGATTAGTVAGLIIQDGKRDLQSFEKSEAVDPERNGGQQGAVSAVVLSLSNPVILDQVSDNLALVLTGMLDPAAPGPCALTVVPSAEEGLRGSGEPVTTAVTFAGMTLEPATCDATVQLGDVVGPVMGSCCVENVCSVTTEADCAGAWTMGGTCDPDPCGEPPAGANFVRGNANDDSKVNIADPIWIINELFRMGDAAVCQSASDANDDGQVDIADSMFLIMYLFPMGEMAPAPSAPFPDCGADPSADDLACEGAAITSCPQ